MVSNNRAGSILAIAALVVYVAGEMLFVSSTLRSSFPILAEWKIVYFTQSVSMALAVVSIAVSPHRFSVKQIVLGVIVFALLAFSAMRTKDFNYLQTFLLVVAIAGTGFDRLCKSYGITVVTVFVIVALLAVTGIIANKDYILDAHLVFTYGFSHPNITAAFLFAGAGTLAYVCWNKRSWWVALAVSVASTVFAYFLLASHGAFALLSLLSLSIGVGHTPWLRNKPVVSEKAFFLFLIITPAVLGFMMLFCTVFYDEDNSVFVHLNSMLHNRPYFAHQYYVAHDGFSWFGDKYSAPASYHNGIPFTSVDCGYCRLALTTGILPFCALAVMYVVAIRRLSRIADRRFLVFVLLMLAMMCLVIESYQLFFAKGFLAMFLSAAFADADSTERLPAHQSK